MFWLEVLSATTIVNGKVLYGDREFVAFDEDKINVWTMVDVIFGRSTVASIVGMTRRTLKVLLVLRI